jgi:hypothetical protein
MGGAGVPASRVGIKDAGMGKPSPSRIGRLPLQDAAITPRKSRQKKRDDLNIIASLLSSAQGLAHSLYYSAKMRR